MSIDRAIGAQKLDLTIQNDQKHFEKFPTPYRDCYLLSFVIEILQKIRFRAGIFSDKVLMNLQQRNQDEKLVQKYALVV